MYVKKVRKSSGITGLGANGLYIQPQRCCWSSSLDTPAKSPSLSLARLLPPPQHLRKLQAHHPEPMDEEQQRALQAGCLRAQASTAFWEVRRPAAATQRAWKRDPPGPHSRKAWVSPSPCPKVIL